MKKEFSNMWLVSSYLGWSHCIFNHNASADNFDCIKASSTFSGPPLKELVILFTKIDKLLLSFRY